MATEELQENDLENQNDVGAGAADSEGGAPGAAEDDLREEGGGTSGDSQDTGFDSGATEDEREQIRALRREERHLKRDRRRQAQESYVRRIESLTSQNQELQQRLAALERRSTGSDMARLDHAIAQAGRAAEHWKNQIANAAAAGAEGAPLLAEAQDNFYNARRQFDDLNNLKRQAEANIRAPAPLDPRLQALASDWMSRNNWYDPEGRDQDSRITRAVDDQLGAEGWDPKTREYWEELDDRLRDALPHRYTGAGKNNFASRQKTGYNEGGGRVRTPVSGSGREVAGERNNGSYRLSPERVTALKEAGLWDDPEARAKAVKRYQQWDKDNANR